MISEILDLDIRNPTEEDPRSFVRALLIVWFIGSLEAYKHSKCFDKFSSHS